MASWPFNKLFSKWPDPGNQEQGAIEPIHSYADPLGEQQEGAYVSERMSEDFEGYLPSHKWVAPPGIRNAPQWVYNTLTLVPFSIDGPYDRPFSYLRSLEGSGETAFAMRWQGMAVETGQPIMYGLTEPDPQNSPGNDIYGLY